MIDKSRAVLWDVDGTLIDSLELHWLSWQDTLARENYILTYERYLGTFGQRNDTILRNFFGPDISLADIERITDSKEACYRELIQNKGIALLPGVENWLKRLAQEGWKQAIASSAPRKNIEVVLEYFGIADLFQASISAQDVTRGKPDPQVFLLAASRLGVEPANCIVVEDAPVGIEGARRAGMRSIGVLTTNPHLEADWEVERLDQLPEDAFAQLLAGCKA